MNPTGMYGPNPGPNRDPFPNNWTQPPAPQTAQPINIHMNQTTPTHSKGINHMLHIIMTLLTGGIWLIVYIPVLIRNK